MSLLAEVRLRAASLANHRLQKGLRLGIGDDCALLEARPGEELAVTTDLSIAGRHFRLDWHPPESVGHRTLARGLSDLAAMGARPVAAFLSLGLPRALARESSHTTRKPSSTWMSRFLDGLLRLARESATPLAGGDLAESPIVVADVVLAGAVPSGKALLRSGARPGDAIYVTGALGGAASALARLQTLFGGTAADSGDSPDPPRIPSGLQAALAAHLYPQPRLAQGLWLRQKGMATAAIDLSDGLSTDLHHICTESDVAAEVVSAWLPIQSGADLAQALHGGEDYELLFTARPETRMPSAVKGIAITRIGTILRKRKGRPAITLVEPRGPVPLERRGWEHFS